MNVKQYNESDKSSYKEVLKAKYVFDESEILDQWYVLHTKANNEERVETHLKQEYTVFLPRMLSDNRRKKRKKKDEPLFPGYIMIQMNQTSDWHKPIRSPGVIDFVRFGESPAVLENIIIDELWQQQVSDLLNFEPIDYKEGDKVQITSGPCELMEGVVYKNRGERIQVLMQILNQPVKTEVSRDALRLAD